MMNLKTLRLTGVASAWAAISLTQAAEEASPKTDDLDSSVAAQCVAANPTQICQPVFCNFAAHPLILPKNHFFEAAESYAEDLRTFVRNHEQLWLRIPVNDPSVTADLNTQEEYAHWHSSAGLPGRR
jgi:CTP:molybdopterin cytidylyltransferase MocA